MKSMKKSSVFGLWNYILVRLKYEMTLIDSTLIKCLTEIFAV
jgi:hypothetical protein